MSTCSCGAEKKDVDRGNAVREATAGDDFWRPSWDDDGVKAQNPFDLNAVYDRVTDPDLKTSISTPELEWTRTEDSFCPNFSEHEEAYDKFVAQVDLVETAARRKSAEEVETYVDVELVRTKVETVRAEAGNLTTEQLAELRDELTAMNESLADRITRRDGQQVDEDPDGSPATRRLRRLREETEQVLETHIEQEMSEREKQAQNESRPEADERASGAEQRHRSGDAGATRNAEPGHGTAKQQSAPDACGSCGQEEVRVERENAARQLRSELEFRELSLGGSFDISLFGDDSELDPTMDVNIEPSVTFERTEETFCGNFAGDQAAYNELINDIDTVERLATVEDPGRNIEESIDVERVQSKVEHLSTEVGNLSAAELTQLQTELTEMQEALSSRIEDLDTDQRDGIAATLGVDDQSGRVRRLQNLEEQTQRVLDNHITEELGERQQQTAEASAGQPDAAVETERSTPGTRGEQTAAQPSHASTAASTDEQPSEPPPCQGCGQQEVRVERQNRLRQITSEMEFRELSFGGSITPGLFDSEGNVDPDIEAGPKVKATATFEREASTFCGNFGGDQDAYDQLRHEIEAIDRLADRTEPGRHIENSIDVEMVRSKIEHLRREVQNLSATDLATLREEMTAMQESLESRIDELKTRPGWTRMLSDRTQRLENLKEQTEKVVENHVTAELAEREREAVDVDRDSPDESASTARRDAASTRDGGAAAGADQQECTRCDEEMARVRRQGHTRQFLKETELRELDLGAGVNIFTGAPTPVASPKFERSADRFCKNFAGDDRAMGELENDLDAVANAANRNEVGQHVEESVDVDMVRSKLAELPDSIDDLMTEKLEELKGRLSEVRTTLSQRIEELRNDQRLKRLRENVPGFPDLSRHARRLQSLKREATEVINQHIDPELARRQGPDTTPAGGGPPGAPGGKSGAQSSPGSTDESRPRGSGAGGTGSGAPDRNNSGAEGTTADSAASGSRGTSGSEASSERGDRSDSGADSGGSGDADGTGDDGDDAASRNGPSSDPEPERAARNTTDETQSAGGDRSGGHDRRGEREEEEEEKTTEEDPEHRDEDEQQAQDDEPQADEDPAEENDQNGGPML